MDYETFESIAHLTRVGVPEEVYCLDDTIYIGILADDTWSRPAEFHNTTDRLLERLQGESLTDSGTTRESHEINILSHKSISELSTPIYLYPDSLRKI